jgi:hypothetical protein
VSVCKLRQLRSGRHFDRAVNQRSRLARLCRR